MADFLSGYDVSSWYGIGAPRGTPSEIIDTLNSEINSVLIDARMKAQLSDLGATVLMGSPAEFGRFIVDETEKWAKAVKFSGAKPD